jgi:chemotaxis protein methyltransferase CheR
VSGGLAEVAELIRQESGISVPDTRAAALRAAMVRAAPGLDPAAVLHAAAEPRTGPGLVDRLIDEITVQESSFLRDSGQLEAIPWHRLREQAAGTIRVWSAGCAAGEEPYTLAMLAAEAFGPHPAPVDVLGTDISRTALAAAAAGHYRNRAVRALGAAMRHRYLEQQPDGRYAVGGPLRKLVRFQRHNLARDPIPPRGETGFDLIVCRNVLIYFTATAVGRVSRLLEHALRPGGVLLLGAADILRRTAAAAASQPAPARLPVPLHWAGAGHSPQRPPGQAGAGHPAGPREQRLRQVLDAAGRGDRDEALEQVTSMLADDPLDADCHFLHGLIALEAGRAAQARDALRAALCVDPGFGLAAFTLGRAFDALGDARAGRRAYEQALRTLDPGNSRHEALLEQIDPGDIAAACRARLEVHQ